MLKINLLSSLVSDSEAKKIYKKCETRESNWVKESKRLGVSDRGLKKYCEKIVGKKCLNKSINGNNVKVKCAFCNEEFTRKSYDFNKGWDKNRVFCSPEHQKKYEHEHSTKTPVSPRFLQEKTKELDFSLRGTAKEMGIDKNTLIRRLHNLGIRQASRSFIVNDELKPFVKKEY